MPKYNYRCLGCDREFELRHSMLEHAEKCILCGEGEIKKIPSLSFSISTSNKTGNIVKEFIEDTKRDIEVEKQKLKKECND